VTEVQHSADCGKTFGGIQIMCTSCNREIVAEMEALSRFQKLLLENPMAGIAPVLWQGTPP